MHVAIIMDGNGRWATQKRLPRTYGHRVGVSRVEECIREAPDAGIKTLTFYAFSTENWKRPQPEIEALFALLRFHVNKKAWDLRNANVKVSFIGSRKRLSSGLLRSMEFLENLTAGCSGLNLNVAIDYGGRDEIIKMARDAAEQVILNQINITDITEVFFDKISQLSNCGAPDLIIRTGGEQRISNFLIWHLAYAELAFVDTLWPDFSPKCLLDEVKKFRLKDRKYGALEVSKVSQVK
jgi:undecaprenyl diphosphate synthase